MAFPMEFWGVEVKAGQPLKVNTDGKLLHLSQASLGESRSGKGSDFVPIHVKCGDQKLVLGTLSPEAIPQLSFDLVFEKEFELSHNWKNGSVYFCGYTSVMQDQSLGTEEFSEDEYESEEDEELTRPVSTLENGLVKLKPETDAAKQNQQAKPKVSIVERMKVDEDDDDDEDDSSDEGDDSEADSDDEDHSDEDDEETPKKAESGKKRPVEPDAKTPTPNKKAKPSTPQKTDGKKGVHTATPHPVKQAGKLDKSKDQPQKSAGQFQCKSCSKTFNSDNALKSHSAAKHSAK